jgi:hypothetical protein
MLADSTQDLPGASPAELARLTNRLGFAWWNTGITPPLGTSENADTRKLAGQVIRSLVRDCGVDCLGLGEVSADDLKYFKEQCDVPSLEIYDGTDRTGRAKFDTGVLFNTLRLRKVDHFTHRSDYGTRSLKVANRVSFELPNSTTHLHVFVSHWPSRVKGEGETLRLEASSRLRTALDSLRTKALEPAIVLMGDYNDEPFDQSVETGLLATRDRGKVAKHPEYLYNPFWRHLGEMYPHLPGVKRDGFNGTCYYSGGIHTSWRLFDQILFSRFFLGNGDWHLNEELTRIVRMANGLDPKVLSGRGLFDHCPVISFIEQ